jgi:hypothetical protein
MAKKSVADLLVETLMAAGVTLRLSPQPDARQLPIKNTKLT